MAQSKTFQPDRAFEKRALLVLSLFLFAATSSSCASLKKFFAADTAPSRQGPILNPFVDYVQDAPGNRENIILRTKKGDRSVEVELPGSNAAMTDFVIPVSPAFRESLSGRGLASSSGGSYDPELDTSFRDRKPSITDREITSRFPSIAPGQEGEQREVEVGLGLSEVDDYAPAADRSYLAAMDHIKQLYRSGRYESALLEIDEMLRAYPTAPRLYQMRGTLLDRIGKTDMALKSWNQALRLEPGNSSLRRFIERKQKTKELASQ